MTITTDGQGNYFLGKWEFSTHDPANATVSYAIAHPQETLIVELNDLFTQAGLTFDILVTQTDLDNNGSVDLFRWASPTDTTNQTGNMRYLYRTSVGASGQKSRVFQYNDVGSQNVDSNRNAGNYQPTDVDIYWGATATSESVIITKYAVNKVDRTPAHFSTVYMGRVTARNDVQNYYNQSYQAGSLVLNTISVGASGTQAKHYIRNQERNILQSGIADYPIDCSDGQTPVIPWMTGAYCFENYPEIVDEANNQRPCIGQLENVKLINGTLGTNYTLAKPTNVTGGVLPDAGRNKWLPVGQFANKIMTVRCG